MSLQCSSHRQSFNQTKTSGICSGSKKGVVLPAGGLWARACLRNTENGLLRSRYVCISCSSLISISCRSPTVEICFDRVARRNIISFRFRIFSCISNGQKQVEWTCCEAATLSLEIVERMFFLIDQKMSCDSRTICYFHKIETIRTFVEAWSEYKMHSATDISFGVFINFGNLFFPFKYLLQYIVFVFAMQPLPSYFMSES